jgi:voltage-gated potassium channel
LLSLRRAAEREPPARPGIIVRMGPFANFRFRGGYSRWLRWTEWPLVVLGLLFLFVLILPLAAPLTDGQERILDVANVVIWVVFVVDYLARLYLVDDRRRFVRTHVLDLIVIVVPFLRPFRLLRLLAIVISTSRRAGGLAVRRVTVYVIGVTVIVMSVSAVVVYDAEQAVPLSDRTIRTLGDAVWWSMVTVSTVGYGDVFPRTPIGRSFAAVLMITGIALVGTITAAVAAWFVNVVRNASTEEGATEAADERAALLAEIRSLSTSLDDLRTEVRSLSITGGSPTSPSGVPKAGGAP